MSHAALIQPHHLSRTAMVYVRQSTPKQLRLHQESTRRQYQLAQRAAELGWPQPRIVVLDADLGRSGTSSQERVDFQRLVSAIGLREVGLVLVTEVSRLSRRNSDWHRVLELCAVFDTLIADDEGMYDPRDPNDRLVLGLKGTLFAAELQILQARMRSGLLNKARRGALELRLPVGYRRLHDATVVLDPDEQVQWTLRTLFDRFAKLKNARVPQRSFQAEGLLMPRYLQDGADYGQLVWVKPTYQMFTQVLTSPVYAGMFVYGRRVQQTCPGDPPKRWAHRLPEEEWEIVVSGVYPAYISEEQYARNREQLRANMYNFIHRRPGAPREGEALVQGLVLCGRCGRRLQVQYSKQGPRYVCREAAVRYAGSTCQSFGQRYLDEAVCTCFFEAIKPAQLDTLLSALATLEQERQARERGWQLRLERARYAARLAQRQYDAVDPENRLVARELETRWNQALEALGSLEREYAVAKRTTLAPLTEEEREAVRQRERECTRGLASQNDHHGGSQATAAHGHPGDYAHPDGTPASYPGYPVEWRSDDQPPDHLSTHWLALSRPSHARGASARTRQSLARSSDCRTAQCRRGAHANRQTLDSGSCDQPPQAAHHSHLLPDRTGSGPSTW